MLEAWAAVVFGFAWDKALGGGVQHGVGPGSAEDPRADRIDVVGVIGPGARGGRDHAGQEKPKIGVIATEATVASNAYLEAIRRASDTAEVVTGCMPAVRSAGGRELAERAGNVSIAAKYLSKIDRFRPDALVLGCTHYPILRMLSSKQSATNVKLIDSGEATAEEVAELLAEGGFGNTNEIAGERRLCDDLDHFYVTDAADRFARVAERFLGTQPSKLEAIEVYGVDRLVNRES